MSHAHARRRARHARASTPTGEPIAVPLGVQLQDTGEFEAPGALRRGVRRRAHADQHRAAAPGDARRAPAGARARRRDGACAASRTSATCTRGFEKLGEYRQYNQIIPLTDRTDYLSPMANNVCLALAVEKLMGIEITERCQVLRVIACEMSRIISHLVWLGTTGHRPRARSRRSCGRSRSASGSTTCRKRGPARG